MELIESASGVRPAGGEGDVTLLGERLEAGVAVDLQHALEVLEMSGRPLRLAVGAVEVNGCRRIRPGPGPVIAHIDPEPSGLGSSTAGIEHGNRRVVGKQLGRGEDMGCQARLQRFQPPASTANPARQSRAVDPDTMPGEDLGLPI
jgi:hypothetical protein